MNSVVMLCPVETSRVGPVGEMLDTPRHRALASETRALILQLVRRSPQGLTVAEIASATGRHLTTVRDHLDQLTETGLLVRERSSDGTPGRPAWRYRSVPIQETARAAGPYRDLAAALVEHIARTEPDPRRAGAAAGRAWGRKLVAGAGSVMQPPIERLIAVLDRLGFAPRVAVRGKDGPSVLHLHVCPFLELVDTSADLMCGLHLGVLHGALDAAGASATDISLDPFGAPSACVVRLGRRRVDAGDPTDEAPRERS